MSTHFLPNFSYSQVPFSFRQGGKDGKWGIWFVPEEGLELLINPVRLCESLDENGRFSHFFCTEKFDGTDNLPVEDIFIEDPPCVAETYIWEIRRQDYSGVAISFNRSEYILQVLRSLQELYRHAVISGKETAYYGEDEDVARYLLRARMAAPDYLFDDIRKKKFQKRLHLPPEPFHAKMVSGQNMSLSIGGREMTLSISDIGPDLFRHEMEHLVFHDESSLYLKEPWEFFEKEGIWLDGDGWEVSLRRVGYIYGLAEAPTLFISIRSHYLNPSKKPIAGFCREKEVLNALIGVFRERYPKSSLGHTLRRHLKFLR